MTKTEHYNLNQWDAGDRVLREDFNADNRKIDTVLASLSADRIYYGSYTGNGATTRTISLPFAPKFMLVMGHAHSNGLVDILMADGTGYCIMANSVTTISQYDPIISGNSLLIRNPSWCNISEKTTYYIAVR